MPEDQPDDYWTRHELFDYIGGMVDGDCSIHASTDLKFALTQTQKAKNVVELLHRTLGGRISSRQRDLKWDLIYELTIRGAAAVDVCRQLFPHCHLKRQQLELACQWTNVQAQAVCVTELDGTRVPFPSVTMSEKYYGIYSDGVAAYLRGEKNPPIKLQGRAVSYDGDDTASLRKKRKHIVSELHRLKEIPHDEITETLSLAYTAGFIDAEGTLDLLHQNTVRITVKQKYQPICNAIAAAFGGHVYRDQQFFSWSIVRGAKAFLTQIQPYLVGKNEQAKLILELQPGDAENVRRQLSLLKGRQKGGSKSKGIPRNA